MARALDAYVIKGTLYYITADNVPSLPEYLVSLTCCDFLIAALCQMYHVMVVADVVWF